MDNGQLLELNGEVEEIIFRNAENGYTVLSLNCSGEEITAVGLLPLSAPGKSSV